eukprot:ANDGO_04001.mRNA.1 hypothetical protein IMG5_183230
MQIAFFVCCVVLIGSSCLLASAQPPPRFTVDANQQPFIYDYGYRRLEDDGTGRIYVEMHGDMTCKVCRGDWNNLIAPLLQKYSPFNVSFTFINFPLSFHRASFQVSKAGVVAESMAPGTGMYWKFVNLMFANQDAFQNGPLFTKSDSDIIDMITALVDTQLGLEKAEFYRRMLLPFLGPDVTPDADEYDMIARAQWKLSTGKGVVGTPIYYVNGVRLLCDGWGVKEWSDMFEFILKTKYEPKHSSISRY